MPPPKNLPVEGEVSPVKITPYDLVNWLTTTLSTPLITNVPVGVISGISPIYIFFVFCFLVSGSLMDAVMYQGAL